jgi:hypothetical protein
MHTLARCFGAAVAAACLAVAPVSAATFSFDNAGVALPSVVCPPPPALPLNCDVTALGSAHVVTGDVFGPWLFGSVFQIGAPLSPTTFAVTGTFGFDDASATNNDFFGTLAGIFDVLTFSTAMDYIVTGGFGSFLGATGWGSGLVMITPQPDGPPTYVERGRFSIPEPGSLALVLGAVVGVLGLRRRL